MKCTGCTGTGVVTSPVWQMFFDECRAAGERVDPDEWARRNGYSGEMDMGPEEIECETCGGTGAIVIKGE